MAGSIRVLVAADYPPIRTILDSLLALNPGITLVDEATSTPNAHRLTSQLSPDVLLLDLDMRGPAVLDTLAAIRAGCPNVKVIVLTAGSGDTYLSALVESGVEGCIFGEEPENLFPAIRAVAEGGTWYSQAVMTRPVRWKTSAFKPNIKMSLTDRELDVLRLVVNGCTDQEICRRLGIAERTLRYRLRTIYTKLEVETRAEAAMRAVQLGLVRPGSDEGL